MNEKWIRLCNTRLIEVSTRWPVISEADLQYWNPGHATLRISILYSSVWVFFFYYFLEKDRRRPFTIWAFVPPTIRRKPIRFVFYRVLIAGLADDASGLLAITCVRHRGRRSDSKHSSSNNVHAKPPHCVLFTGHDSVRDAGGHAWKSPQSRVHATRGRSYVVVTRRTEHRQRSTIDHRSSMADGCIWCALVYNSAVRRSSRGVFTFSCAVLRFRNEDDASAFAYNTSGQQTPAAAADADIYETVGNVRFMVSDAFYRYSLANARVKIIIHALSSELFFNDWDNTDGNVLSVNYNVHEKKLILCKPRYRFEKKKKKADEIMTTEVCPSSTRRFSDNTMVLGSAKTIRVVWCYLKNEKLNDKKLVRCSSF